MKISLGNEETVREGFSIREDGVLLLRCKISYTRFDGAQKYNTLYETIASNCEKWARNVLSVRAREEYLASTDPQKRFRFGYYEYTLSSYPSGERDGVLCVVSEVCLSRRGEGIAEISRSSQLWREKDLALMPDRLILPRASRRKLWRSVKKRRPIGLLLRGVDVYAFGARGSEFWEERII